MPDQASKSTAVRRTGLVAVFLAATLTLAPGVAAAARSGHHAQPTSRVVVLLAQGSDWPDVLERHGLRRTGRAVPEIGLVPVAVPSGASYPDLARRLTRDPAVVAVDREVRRRARFVPSDGAFALPDPAFGDPSFGYQWNLEREGFPAAWDQARGDGVLVGVIDSGIDSSHPEFTGTLAAVRDQDSSGTGTADEVGHGTHVAGLACAGTGNGVGMAGAGFGCRLIVEKSDLTSASVAASIVDATDRGARVINMSFGGGGASAGERRALRYAFRRNVVLVAAAADEAIVEQGHPARDLQPTGTGADIGAGIGLVVTAADASGARASFAGRGSQISLAAYGDTNAGGPPGIFSTFPADTTQIETGETRPPSQPCPVCRTAFDGDTRYAYLAGTSMAAPQVAGAAALVRAANPRLRNTSVLRLLKRTARRSGGWSSELGWGILDAGAAVSAARALAGDTVAPRTRARGPRRRRSGRVMTLRWKGRDLAPPGVAAAGIESYRVHARKRGGRYRLITTTRRKSTTFRARSRGSYTFYVQARDRAGNLEAAPRQADFVVRVRPRG